MKQLSDLSERQSAAITFILGGEDALLAADVGTGKTVISLTAALRKPKIKRWLVLAPLLVATDTWANEPAEWQHLQHVRMAIACGPEPVRIAAVENPQAQFVVLNYENLPWLMERYGAALPFDGLICDEIDKLKSVSSNRFKMFRNKIKQFKSRIGLTGTLIPNDLTELWGQIYMVDGGQSFGRSFYAWRKKFFYPIDYNQYNWRPFPDTESKLLQAISDLVFRVEGEDLPPVRFLEPLKLEMPVEMRETYNKLERDLFIDLGDDKNVDAANSAVLTGKLQQICAGFSYLDVPGKDRGVLWHTQMKFGWLDQLRNYLGDKQLLVFYHFNEELAELKRIYPGLHYLGGGVSNTQARKSIALWNAGEIDMLALHPASAGHGLNLQKSGAHHIAFLTLPWSGGMLKQVIGRLARRGQSAKEIFVYAALFANSIDETVFKIVRNKHSRLEDFLDAIKDRAA